MPIIRKKLTADEFSPPYLRYNSECDCVQFTPDGGTTWVDQPANDPRYSITYLLPPLTGSDIQCRAAEGMTEVIRAMVDKRLEDIDAVGLAGWIMGFVTFIPGFNVLYALVLAFAFTAVAIAGLILETVFTDEAYDAIRCIFYCAIAPDGQMDEAAYDEAYARLIELDPIVRTWVQETMHFMGWVGMSNAGVELEAAADCDECECPCPDVQIICPFDNVTEITNGSIVPNTDPPCVIYGEYIGYVDPIGYTTQVLFRVDLGEVISITSVDFAGAFTGIANAFTVLNSDGTTALGATVNPPAGYDSGGTWTPYTPIATQYIWVLMQATNTAPSIRDLTLYQATIHCDPA